MKKECLFILPLFFSNPVYADCNQANIFFEKATTYKKDKQFKQAFNNFHQAALLCPNFLVFYGQGQTLIKLNRYDEALDSFKKAREFTERSSKSEANALARIALIHTQKNALQKASIYIEQAYRINEENSPKWMLHLRRVIDRQSINIIASAEEINLALVSGKSFGVKPKIQLNSITFKFNSTEFTAKGQRQVTELGKALIKGNQLALLIGHTDKKGDNAYNMGLSKSRADAVKKALVNYNSALNNVLRTEGKGEEELKYQGDDEADHQLNRRVEMQLM